MKKNEVITKTLRDSETFEKKDSMNVDDKAENQSEPSPKSVNKDVIIEMQVSNKEDTNEINETDATNIEISYSTATTPITSVSDKTNAKQEQKKLTKLNTLSLKKIESSNHSSELVSTSNKFLIHDKNRISASPFSQTTSMFDPRALSPSEEWMLRKRSKDKKRLSQNSVNTIASGWKIRNQLYDVKQSATKTVNSFFLENVASGSIEDVKTLLNISKVDPELTVDKNSINQRDFDALRIAIQNRNLQMVKLLLNHQVILRYNLFHAIEADFIEAVEAILDYDPCTRTVIKQHNYYFKVGLTPFIFAAHKNNYEILKLLYRHGHRMKDALNWWDGIHYTMEASDQRMMISTAKASPAYITLICEETNSNPIALSLQLIDKVRNHSRLELEFYDFYKALESQIEDFMCALLDRVQSSEELANLFQYDFNAYWKSNSFLESFGEGATPLKLAQSRLDLLDLASEHNLMKFVTHYNSQFALSYLRYRYTTFLKTKSEAKRLFFGILFGLLFPVLSLLYLISPKSTLGGIITRPNISYFCHLSSDLVFIILLILNIALRSHENEYLGSPPTATEWLIFFWVLGKWVQEVKQAQNRGLRSYLRDMWNFIDLIQLSLFALTFILRFVDYIQHANDQNKIRFIDWKETDARLISVGFLAWAYVFVFLKVISLTRTNRLLGPLQVSMAKMLLNVVHFFFIYILILFSFALALTEIFWYYSESKSAAVLCHSMSTNTSDCNFVFTDIGSSLINLFWSIFGYLEISEIPYDKRLAFLHWIGISVLFTYQVAAVIVMTNTLIAMMAQTFDDISKNRDMEWKFHRTVVWIRFIRRELTRPPPMNLLPNPHAMRKQLWRIVLWAAVPIFHRSTTEQTSHGKQRNGGMVIRSRQNPGQLRVRQELRDMELEAITEKANIREQLAQKIISILLQRYKFSVLVNRINK